MILVPIGVVNLLQTVVEGFLFYHPAVWWISSVIRTERENCCDDLVVAADGNAHEYATALTALEENRWAANSTALAATGGVLIKRVHRLLYPRGNPRTFLAPAITAGMLTIVMALTLTAWESNSGYDKWVNEDVTYIITDAERTAFKQLQTNEERDMFVGGRNCVREKILGRIGVNRSVARCCSRYEPPNRLPALLLSDAEGAGLD